MGIFRPKICGDMSSAGFDNRFDIITISNAACLESGVSQRAGVSIKGGAPLAHYCLREGHPMPMMRFNLVLLHDALFALGVFFQTALAPLPYFFSSLSSTSDLSTK